MKIDFRMKYREWKVPPRCRKPRHEDKECIVKLSIPEITADKAQVAFIVSEHGNEKRKVVYYRGRLYRQCQDRRKDELANGPLFVNQKVGQMTWQWRFECYTHSYGPKEDYLHYVRTRAKRWLIVDGDVYEKCCEPFYSVTTFGLGRNHGGTGFFVEWANPVARKLRGWSALDTHAAIEGAVRIALARGDTESEAYIRGGGNGHIEVFMPEAVKLLYDNPVPPGLKS